MPGKSFSIETAGGVLSGVLISSLTSGILNTYQLLLLIILLAFSYVLLTFFELRREIRLIYRIIMLFLAAAIIIFQPDIFFRQILLTGIKVTGSVDTPYGNITYGSYKGEKSTYYNQRLLSYNSDVAEREENIHYAMLQSDSPEKVILISGSLSSQVPEILKYPVKEIVYIERDPALARTTAALKDTVPVKLTVLNSDAFRYIRISGEPADVIILSVPPPSTLQLNRYYTTEFFIAVRKKLREGGVFMCSPGPGNDYYNKESINLYSSVYNSLSSVFRNVRAVVGNKLYFIASDKDLSVSFCQMTGQKHISNIYVSPDFLSDDLITKKTEEITALMDPKMRQNKSSFPVASYHFESYNFSKYSAEKIPAIALMVLIFAVPLFFVKKRYMLMYFSASALAGFEIIILLTLQIIIGNMYQLTGLVLAGLMAGLAVGSGIKIRVLNEISLVWKGISLFLFYAAAGIIVNHIIGINHELYALAVILPGAFLPAAVTGHIFHELTAGRDEINAASSVYSADLAGSALGFILTAGVLIPALGIQYSIFLLSALIFAGLLFGTIGNKL
jgi:spermidine synthase